MTAKVKGARFCIQRKPPGRMVSGLPNHVNELPFPDKIPDIRPFRVVAEDGIEMPLGFELERPIPEMDGFVVSIIFGPDNQRGRDMLACFRNQNAGFFQEPKQREKPFGMIPEIKMAIQEEVERVVGGVEELLFEGLWDFAGVGGKGGFKG
jgi:hypothetical protein